jgi:hypothetical protein
MRSLARSSVYERVRSLLMPRMQRLQMSMAGRWFLDGVMFDIAMRLRFCCADDATCLKICTLSTGSVGVAGRERGASEEYVVTFADFCSESSGHLVAMQTPNYTATDAYATRMRGSICDISTSADAAIKAKQIGFLRYAVEGILQEGR